MPQESYSDRPLRICVFGHLVAAHPTDGEVDTVLCAVCLARQIMGRRAIGKPIDDLFLVLDATVHH